MGPRSTTAAVRMAGWLAQPAFWLSDVVSAAVAAGLLVVALGTLLAQIAVTRARGVTRALRVGE